MTEKDLVGEPQPVKVTQIDGDLPSSSGPEPKNEDSSLSGVTGVGLIPWWENATPYDDP